MQVRRQSGLHHPRPEELAIHKFHESSRHCSIGARRPPRRLAKIAQLALNSIPLPARILTFPLSDVSMISPTGAVRPACVSVRFGNP